MFNRFVKRAANGLVSIATFTLSLSAYGGAMANDAAIEILLQSAGFDLQNIDDYNISRSARSTADRKMGQRRYALENGMQLMLSGPDSGNVSDIDKVVVSFAEDQITFERSVSELRDLLGAPNSGRRDITVWKTQNQSSINDQSQFVEIIAGAHGPDKNVISINRRGLRDGNNRDELRSINATPAKKRVIIPKPQKNKSRKAVF